MASYAKAMLTGPAASAFRKLNAIKKPMPEDAIWKYFIQIVKAIQALHQMKILHRDIKPGNIMVTSNDVIKLGDLGIAKLLKHTMAKTQIGTPHYMPPEIWKNKPYSFTGDTWALGCVLYEMACFCVPFEARSMQELRYKVRCGDMRASPCPWDASLGFFRSSHTTDGHASAASVHLFIHPARPQTPVGVS